jgi:hypothetical protein
VVQHAAPVTCCKKHIARFEGWPAFPVLPALRNILPGGFFAGQDIPELLDDSLVLIHSQHKKTASLRVFAISFLSSNWLAACFYSCGEKTWTADSMQHVRVCGRKVRLSN